MANADLGPQRGSGEPHSRSALVEHVTPEFARAAVRMLDAGGVVLPPVPLGGRRRRGRAGGRDGVLAPLGELLGRRARRANRDRLDASWDGGRRARRQGMYLSFDTSLRPERITTAFPLEVIARLRAIKAEVDPDGVFGDNFSIDDRPLPHAA